MAINTPGSGVTIGGAIGEVSGLTAGSNSQGSSIIKVGPGTLTLSGANAYTGPTTVSAGTLYLTRQPLHQ